MFQELLKKPWAFSLVAIKYFRFKIIQWNCFQNLVQNKKMNNLNAYFKIFYSEWKFFSQTLHQNNGLLKQKAYFLQEIN